MEQTQLLQLTVVSCKKTLLKQMVVEYSFFPEDTQRVKALGWLKADSLDRDAVGVYVLILDGPQYKLVHFHSIKNMREWVAQDIPQIFAL